MFVVQMPFKIIIDLKVAVGTTVPVPDATKNYFLIAMWHPEPRPSGLFSN
jgi:hypothetical protein